jgi:hypothetical protein
MNRPPLEVFIDCSFQAQEAEILERMAAHYLKQLGERKDENAQMMRHFCKRVRGFLMIGANLNAQYLGVFTKIDTLQMILKSKETDMRYLEINEKILQDKIKRLEKLLQKQG